MRKTTVTQNNQFRVQAKSWFLTWPNCPLSKEEALDLLKAIQPRLVSAVICREIAPTTGLPHLHAYVQLPTRLDCKNPRYWDLGQCHGQYEKARNIDDCVKYIKKDGDLLEFGEIDWTEKVDSRKEHRRCLGKRIIEGEPLADVVRDDPSLLFGLHKLRQDVSAWTQISTLALDAPDTRGIWIYGGPGLGKSRYVRHLEPSLYLKAQNKWWDNYQFEKAVLIDDFDKQGICLAHYLKIWADRYACNGEIKGAHVPLVHHKFYVTSNYSIDDLFPKDQDPQLNHAIHRRFKTIHFTDQTLSLLRVRSKSVDSN